jgi:predicted ThiF/HesA family dinucleotide-utilizing enzyme
VSTRGRRTGYDNGKDRAKDWVVTVQVDHFVPVTATTAERAEKYAIAEMGTRYALGRGRFKIIAVERADE